VTGAGAAPERGAEAFSQRATPVRVPATNDIGSLGPRVSPNLGPSDLHGACLQSLAKQLGYKDAVTLLLETLQEEKATDEKLPLITRTSSTAQAAKAA
jgi:hypothetical protein